MILPLLLVFLQGQVISDKTEIDQFLTSLGLFGHYQCGEAHELQSPTTDWNTVMTGFESLLYYPDYGNVTPLSTVTPNYNGVAQIGSFTFLDHHVPLCNKYQEIHPFIENDDQSIMLWSYARLEKAQCTRFGWLDIDLEQVYMIEIDNINLLFPANHTCAIKDVPVPSAVRRAYIFTKNATAFGQAIWLRHSDNSGYLSNAFVLVSHDGTNLKNYTGTYDQIGNGTPPVIIPNGWTELYSSPAIDTHIHDNDPACASTHPTCVKSGELGTSRVILHHNLGGEAFESNDISFLAFGESFTQSPILDIWIDDILFILSKPINGQAVYVVNVPSDDPELIGYQVYLQAILWDTSQQKWRPSVGARVKLHQ